jgi:MoaA/NifB/PqqE/SkfB family radical SAM enzyme
MMPTVMLTTHCPNACEWCFARPKMEEYRAQGIREMSWDDFTVVVDFYERSGLRHMILLGGDPALHSRFLDILRHLRERSFSALVVSTGILPDPLVCRIADEHLPNIKFAVNSTSYFLYGESKKEQINHFLRRMGRVTSLGYTITERDAVEKKIEPILDRIAMIMKFGLIRHLQFQLAVPGERNRLFVPFDRYRDAADLLVSWFRLLRRNGISCGIDCHCMPACALPKDTVETGIFSTACNHFMIDIGPDLEVWPCFPLSGRTDRLTRFKDLDEINKHFGDVLHPLQSVYDEHCGDCAERAAGSCHGGCRGFQHLRGNPGVTQHSNIPLFQHSARRTVPCA